MTHLHICINGKIQSSYWFIKWASLNNSLPQPGWVWLQAGGLQMTLEPKKFQRFPKHLWVMFPWISWTIYRNHFLLLAFLWPCPFMGIVQNLNISPTKQNLCRNKRNHHLRTYNVWLWHAIWQTNPKCKSMRTQPESDLNHDTHNLQNGIHIIHVYNIDTYMPTCIRRTGIPNKG